MNNKSTQNQTRDGDWDAFFSSWLLGLRLADPINPSLLFLDMTNGVDVCVTLSHSRSNIGNVYVVTSLLISWYKYAKSYKLKDRVIIFVPYKDQKILYQEHILYLAQNLGCHAKILTYISTINGFHGRESSMLILDLVRIKGSEFLDQEQCMTVVFSRYPNSFIIIDKTAVLENEIFHIWKDTKKFLMASALTIPRY